jgi:hypothetical protein
MMAVTVKKNLIWNMASGDYTLLLFSNPEAKGSRFLQNVGKILKDHMSSYCRRYYHNLPLIRLQLIWISENPDLNKKDKKCSLHNLKTHGIQEVR